MVYLSGFRIRHVLTTAFHSRSRQASRLISTTNLPEAFLHQASLSLNLSRTLAFTSPFPEACCPVVASSRWHLAKSKDTLVPTH